MGGGATPASQDSTTSQTTNSTNTAGANPYIIPQLQSGVSQLTNYYNQNPSAPAYYPGGTYAGQGGDTQAAIQAMYNRGTQGSVFQPAANQTIESILQPGYTSVANDPYFQQSLAAGFAPQNEQFNNTTLPNLRSQFEGSGRNLGGADMGQADIALKNLQQTQSNAAAQATQSQFAQNQQNQFQALSQLPAMQNMDYQNIGALTAAGQAQDQNAQNVLSANNAAYGYNTTAQPNYISDFLSRIQAAYPGGQTVGQGTSNGQTYGTGSPSTNPTGSAIGTGAAVAGTALSAAALFM